LDTDFKDLEDSADSKENEGSEWSNGPGHRGGGSALGTRIEIKIKGKRRPPWQGSEGDPERDHPIGEIREIRVRQIPDQESRIPHDFHEVAQFVFDLRAVGQGLSDLVTHGVAEVTSETVHRHLQRAVAQSQLGTDP
jgi:hypothetical protein